MILRFLTIAGFCVILLLLASCQTNSDRWDEIAASGFLRIGVDPTYPPFAVAEGNEVHGLDIDLAHALADELGLQPRFTYFGYDGLYDALTTGQVDVLISALVVAPERTRDVAYTQGYFDAGQFLVVPAEEDSVNAMRDLAGKTLAVEQGALGHAIALEWQRKISGLEIAPYPTVDEVLAAVRENSAAAALVDQVSARLYLHQQQPSQSRTLRLLPEPIFSEPFAIAVRIGDRTLREKLSTAIDKLSSEGELELIITRWLDN